MFRNQLHINAASKAQHLSIRGKILLGFGIIFFLIALFSAVSILSVRKINKNAGFVKDIAYSHALYLIDFENLVKQVAGHVSSSIDSGYYMGMKEAKDDKKILDEKIKEAEILFDKHEDILKAVRGLKPRINDFVELGDKLVHIIIQQRWTEVAAAQKKFYARQDEILKSIAGIKALGVRQLDDSIADISTLTKNTLYITTVIMLITLLSGISLAYFTGYQIVRPIQKLMDVMKEAEKGNFAVRSHMMRYDEMGSLATGFNEMLSHIQKRDAELEIHRNHLEELVMKRTFDLEKANEQLERSNKFSKTILDSMSDSISIINVDTMKIVAVNKVFQKEFGLREDEMLGITCHSITHHRSDVCKPPDDPCPLLTTVETGDHTLVEHLHSTADNKKVYVEVSTSPIKDAAGKVIQVVHVGRDITDRKNAENIIVRSQQTMQAILNSMPYAVVVIGKDKKIRSANEAALKLMIYDTEKQIVGMTCNHTLCPAQEGKCPILDCHETVDRAERILITKDGKRIPILKTVVPVEIDGEDVLLEAFIDITERKKAEERLKNYSEELEKINEEMKNFAYIVSHDLRAPLVNIKGFSDELGRSIKEFTSLLEKYLGRFDAGEKQKTEDLLKKDIPQALGFIGSSVTRMDALINSILKLSRLGRNELKPELLRTEDIVRNILKSLAHQIDMHKAEVTIGPLPEIIMDKTAAEQIFGNLLDNALKYLEPARSGKIEFTAEQNAGETTFTVRDNGRGIAKEDIQRVFELFRRVGKLDVPGEGMGLTYVKTLVRRMGGRIWCESKPGEGSTFSFTIPDKSTMPGEIAS